jgi:hypothetical protein
LGANRRANRAGEAHGARDLRDFEGGGHAKTANDGDECGSMIPEKACPGLDPGWEPGSEQIMHQQKGSCAVRLT